MSFQGSPIQVYGGNAIAVREDQPDTLEQLVAAWLLSKRSQHTRDAYLADIKLWLAWLSHHDVDVMTVRIKHANAWAREMEHSPGPRGRPASRATVNRRLATIASFYDYLVRDEVIEVNRVKSATRHDIDKRHSPTFRPSREETQRILAEARADGPRTRALVTLLLYSGARVTEVINANVEDFGTDMGTRTFTITRKGGRVEELPLKPAELVGGALDDYLDHRARRAHVRRADLTGPVFLDRIGKPLTRQAAANIISGLGRRTGCPRLTPHSLRHTFATMAKLAGAEKDHIQEAMGHLDPKTTQRYIGRVKAYDNHPGDKIANYLAEATT